MLIYSCIQQLCIVLEKELLNTAHMVLPSSRILWLERERELADSTSRDEVQGRHGSREEGTLSQT